MLKVAEAAKLLGVSEQYIRCGLQQASLPFGSAVKVGKDRCTYHIVEDKVYEYLGRDKRGS